MYSTACQWGSCPQRAGFKVASELSLEDVTCHTTCLNDLSPTSTRLDDISPASGRSESSDESRIFEKTVKIIFDWDDTLFCSTAAARNQWTREELKELEETVRSVLNTAMCLGDTLIVTNGVSTWVQDSARRFLPGLLPTIARLPVISARALFERSYPGDPYMWKRAAFEQLLLDNGPTYEDGLNLVALGDQNPEIEAAQGIIRSLGGPSRVKTVKFKEAPSVRDLIGQLVRVECELEHIIGAQDSCNLCVRPQIPDCLHHRLNRDLGWSIEVVENDQGACSFSKFLSLVTLKDMVSIFS